MKCNNYHSSYAFLNDKPISVNDYIKKSKPINIKCCHNHPLIFVNNKHFIHKFNDDLDPNDIHSLWHKEWQSYFPYIEITYIKDDLRQIKTRRADIVLPKTKYNIEIQHSKISKLEVYQRKCDYLIHNRDIIWIINGSSEGSLNIIVINDNDNDNDESRFIIEFNDSNKWMYESFINYEYIFIDYDNYIYKFNPKIVKNNMIDVIRLNRKEFIKNLQDGIFTIKKEIIKQSNLYIKQQGAGNGKTFGLIQNLKNKNFSHYDYFIIVSKQHSAKTIIYNEFISQLNNGNLNELELINDEKEHYTDKKYQISFKNKITGKISYILISTIDSLMYKLGDKNNTHINKFEGIVKSLCDDCINEDFTNMTFIKYYKNNFSLNKKLCLFIDETQDLSKDYGDAIIRIIKDKYIDAYIVGDALQSISIDNNAFVYLNSLNSLKNINIIKFDKLNIVRRFNSKQLIEIINNIIPFSNYSLPLISSYDNNNNNNNDNDNNDFEIIDGKKYKNYKSEEENFDNINYNLNMIMDKYKYEVEINNYKPEDFLIITPFTSNNPIISILETRIQLYWLRKENPEEYKNYAIFHKSECGSSINLTDSNDATRLVSIHTSKGDGRNIVFVIGLNKNSLLKFSTKPDNIIYDSLIHVALTRMKKKLYFFIDDENDCIARKIKTVLNNYYLRTSNIKAKKPNIFNIFKFIKIKNNVNDTYLKLLELIINKTIYSNYSNFININNKVIDITHHYLRYASMRILLIIKIFKLESDKHQIKAQILSIKDKKISSVDNWKDYSNYFMKIDKDCKDNNKYKSYDICLLELSKTTEYQKYFNIIQDFSYNIKSKIKTFAKYNYLCPYECMILNYILEFVNNGPYANISIIELYNITNIYYKAYTPNITGHSNCKCNQLFNNNNNDNDNNLHKYLLNHYEYITNIGIIYDKFLSDYPNVNWLLTHNIRYLGNTYNFTINNIFDFIGYDNDNIYIIYLKPQINELNYNEILLSSIIDTFIINSYNNIADTYDDDEDDDNNDTLDKYQIKNKNKERFKDKKIFTIIFSLNTDDYIKLDWANLIKDNNNDLKKLFIEDIITTYINDELYYYYRYFRNKYKDEDKKIIDEIIKDIDNTKNKETFPNFIITFFTDMKNFIIRYKKDTFENYDDINYFNEKLKEVLKEELYAYFNVEE